MDWLKALDFGRALRNVETDILGDWYRDPWGWPELRYAVERAPSLIVARLNEAGARRVLPLDVVKENFVIRPAVVLDPLDRLCYQALVDTLSKTLIGKLHGWAYGWRLPRKSQASGEYVRNAKEWEFYRARLEALALGSAYGLSADIVSFFASIGIPQLMDDIRAVSGDGAVVKRLDSFLTALQAEPGRPGLPQRCWASSVLAQFFLLPVDETLHASAPTFGGLSLTSPGLVRWMDDIWLFGEVPMELRLVQLTLQEQLHRRGLRLNAAKTELRENAVLVADAMELEHSAVDEALSNPVPDTKPLEHLVAQLVMRPDSFSRTSIRFATTRVRTHRSFKLVRQFQGIAMRAPHGADHFARLFRESGAWKEMGGWYVKQTRDLGTKLVWTTYHLGTMFPSDERPPASLVTFWKSGLSNGRLPVLHVPLACQRLAAWDKTIALAAIRSAVLQPAYQSPFTIRAMVLAGRKAGLNASEARQLLGQYSDTEITLQYLGDRQMKPPRPTSDFATG